MTRLVFSGVMEKYPNLKFIYPSLRCDAPLFTWFVCQSHPRKAGEVMKLTKPPVEYFKKFYADTVLDGNTPALDVRLCLVRRR